ncbi:hypothetical protein THZG08_270018 [Vibrio owensii]|uniref:Uncharacterized protein n=1 Tax=Vibrio owensii TaxID=696485 RepID=A0AAU9QE69_9VIBR|nr:hypothetical protein THZG08_270018 [Vibrio owensii]CAH1540648.1 hypothetical protein THF1D04_60276 [Vibrio owensii]CAH1566051.1 hypothetical protein THOA03_280017 [Vibrio owensii]CAH1596103.1 hypothetical protein THZB04_80271 [Vibrio owensii]
MVRPPKTPSLTCEVVQILVKVGVQYSVKEEVNVQKVDLKPMEALCCALGLFLFDCNAFLC